MKSRIIAAVIAIICVAAGIALWAVYSNWCIVPLIVAMPFGGYSITGFESENTISHDNS